jgi:hypothetical protein
VRMAGETEITQANLSASTSGQTEKEMSARRRNGSATGARAQTSNKAFTTGPKNATALQDQPLAGDEISSEPPRNPLPRNKDA